MIAEAHRSGCLPTGYTCITVYTRAGYNANWPTSYEQPQTLRADPRDSYAYFRAKRTYSRLLQIGRSVREVRRKVLLPVFQLSELTVDGDPRALMRVIKQGKGHPAFAYQYRFVWDAEAERSFHYNLFPVVLDRNSVPWPLGTLYILTLLQADATPNMRTYRSKADDLGDYKQWLDTHDEPDLLMFDFPQVKLRRPTYRYRGHLKRQIDAQELASTTGNRRIGTVVSFYRSLIENSFFVPAYPPWEERTYGLELKTSEGRAISKKVVSTDLRLPTPESDDPFEGSINDGGKLRPLTGMEQDWVLEATKANDNTECYLIQFFILATGARIQTAGTLRLRHFARPNPGYAKSLTGEGEVLKLKAGPGTGIDTKHDKKGVLQIPRPVYELLHTYALSERAKMRWERFTSTHGEHRDPYLFITQQGNPYYAAKADVQRFNPHLDRRHEKTGQAVRQFIKEHVIPYVRQHHDERFQFHIHDLRASFGMNMTEILMKLVQERKMTLHQARLTVKDLLWHERLATSDLYLDYRRQMTAVYAAVNGYGEQLRVWIERAMSGIHQSHE